MRVAPLALIATAALGQVPASRWLVHSERSPVDQRYSASIQRAADRSLERNQSAPVLAITCVSGQLGAHVYLERHRLETWGGGTDTYVLANYGTGKPVREHLSIRRGDHRYLDFDSSRKLIARLRQAESAVAVRFTLQGGVGADVVFQVDGLEEALRPISGGCKV